MAGSRTLGAGANTRRVVAIALMGTVVLFGVRMANAVCCVCQGVSEINGCGSFDTDCSESGCARICAGFNGSVLACCPSTTGCSGGVAADDACGSFEDVCTQKAFGPNGFCAGTCVNGTPTATATDTPTFTPTNTPTSTPTNTPTATPTNTPVPIGGACSTPAQCATPGFCVENVCCNAPCTGPLQRCNLPDELGSCVSAAAPAPTLTPWGLLILALLLAGGGAFALRYRMRGH